MCEAATHPADIPDPLARADQLEREITDLCARINAAGYRLLQLIAELDHEAPWGAWGLASCAHWLNWRCGICMNSAREKVRVAHALKILPAISAAFAGGEMSFSKVRALTRIADPANETELLELARHATAAQLEKLVRAYRRVERLEECEQALSRQAARELDYYHDDDGSLVIRARLPAEQGEILLRALDAAMAARRASVVDAEPGATGAGGVSAETPGGADGIDQRRADALLLLAETTLRHGPEPLSAAERYQVVVHVSAETLAGDGNGRSELESGQRLAVDTTRRLACDASLVRITEDAAGNPLDIGRRTRAVPPAMRRALQSRDGGCRFPGCTNDRFVDAHHIRHWADGGATAIDNLVLLCRHHHRLVHEGGFGVERLESGEIRFTRPDGRAIDPHPGLPAIESGGEAWADEERSIDAARWIIPGDAMDYGMAIDGLLRYRSSVNYPDGAIDRDSA